MYYCKSLYFSWSHFFRCVWRQNKKYASVIYTNKTKHSNQLNLWAAVTPGWCYSSQCCLSNISSGSTCFLYNQNGKPCCFKTSGKLGLPAASAPSPGPGYSPMHPTLVSLYSQLCSCPYRQICAWCACTCRVHRRCWQILPRLSFANRWFVLHAERGGHSLLEILCTASLLSYHFLISNLLGEAPAEGLAMGRHSHALTYNGSGRLLT